MNDNYTTDKLIQYLDGELEDEDFNAMQERIAADKAVAAELENLRLAKAAVKIYGLKKTVSAIHTEMMKERGISATRPTIGIRRIFQYSTRIAAVLIIAVGITVLYQYFSATPEQLFRNKYEAFTLHETRGTSSSAMEEFYKKGYPDAVMDMFKKLPSPQPEDYFLNGNAALSINNAPAAIRSFRGLQEKNKLNGTHFFEEDTEYYLGLAYLNNNEPASALPLFEKIHADKNHTYHHKVTAWFLRKLERLAKEK